MANCSAKVHTIDYHLNERIMIAGIDMKKIAIIAYAAAFMAMPGSHAFSAGDAAAGEKVFKKCKACHVVKKEQNRTGPHLVNLMGRTAGSVEGFKKYSKAMKSSGIVWNEETLDGYLKAPKKYL